MTSAAIPVVTLAAIGGMAIERRLAATFPRAVSTLATLGLLASAPALAGSAARGLAPAIVFAAASLAFSLLALRLPAGARARGIAPRALAAALLAMAPTAVVVARSSWRQAYPDALLAALFGGQGLLYGGPLLWAGFFGLRALRRENRALANVCLLALVPGVASLAIGTETGDVALRTATWLPFLAPGIARAFEGLRQSVAHRPQRALTFAGLLLVGWNLLFMEQYRLLLIPNDNTASFAHITANSSHLLARSVGTPMAWPANWIFAARTGVAAERWDAVAGRRLFSGPEDETATVEIGDDDSPFAPDLALLGEGFGLRRTCGRGWCRDVYDRGRVVIPLENAGKGNLTVGLRARGEGALRLTLDRPAGSVVADLGPDFTQVTLVVPARLVRPGLHVLEIEALGGGRATLDRITIERSLGAASATAPPR